MHLRSSAPTERDAVVSSTNSRNELDSQSYDADGNATTAGCQAFTYDAWNHIMTVGNGCGTTYATYAYDANGTRISETSGDTTTDYYYNGPQMIEQRQAGTVTSQNVFNTDYVNDLLLRDDNSTTGSLGYSDSGLGERLFAQHDANFNVTALVDTSGDVKERFTYDPYGTVYVLSPTWTSTTDAYNWNYLFQGMWQDPVSGLYYTPNWDYNATTGAWMEQDPAGYVNGANLYQCEVSSPTESFDPNGLQADVANPFGYVTPAAPRTSFAPYGDSVGPVVASGSPSRDSEEQGSISETQETDSFDLSIVLYDEHLAWFDSYTARFLGQYSITIDHSTGDLTFSRHTSSVKKHDNNIHVTESLTYEQKSPNKILVHFTGGASEKEFSAIATVAGAATYGGATGATVFANGGEVPVWGWGATALAAIGGGVLGAASSASTVTPDFDVEFEFTDSCKKDGLWTYDTYQRRAKNIIQREGDLYWSNPSWGFGEDK